MTEQEQVDSSKAELDKTLEMLNRIKSVPLPEAGMPLNEVPLVQEPAPEIVRKTHKEAGDKDSEFSMSQGYPLGKVIYEGEL